MNHQRHDDRDDRPDIPQDLTVVSREQLDDWERRLRTTRLDIETQLGNKEEANPEWRRRAKWALRCVIHEAGRIRDEKTRRGTSQPEPRPRKTPQGARGQVYPALLDLARVLANSNNQHLARASAQLAQVLTQVLEEQEQP